MPLGTLDRTPPPFFRQGPSALTKLAVFSALAVFLMAADSRLKYTQPVRAALATVLLPIQRTLLVPVELAEGGSEYLQGLTSAIAGEREARAKLVAQAERSARVEQLAAENARLRALLDLRPSLTVKSHTAEVLYEATDPYSRKLFIDRGSTHGVLLGSPVINDAGVLGQVTRVYPLSSEITLLADKDAAIPVLNPRTQQRSAAFGSGDGIADLPNAFMETNPEDDMDSRVLLSKACRYSNNSNLGHPVAPVEFWSWLVPAPVTRRRTGSSRCSGRS